jgi:hypothetical protein
MNKNLEKHLKRLNGARIIQPIEGNDGIVGFEMQLMGKKGKMPIVDVWILRDPEGNGPGWLEIEEPEEVP